MFLHISACSWRFPFVRFVPARPWHSANAAAEKQPQPENNYARFHPNPSKIHQKSMQNPSETDHIGGQDRSESDLESNSASNNSPGSFRKQLLAPLGWFWPSFWAPPGAKGVPKSSILASVSIKSRKYEVREEVLEKAWKSNGILIRKCKLWRCKIIDFHCFFNRIVLSAFFEKSWNFDRKLLSKCFQNPLKIWVLASEGRIFAILGRFWVDSKKLMFFSRKK